jgi:hypothetical protein
MQERTSDAPVSGVAMDRLLPPRGLASRLKSVIFAALVVALGAAIYFLAPSRNGRTGAFELLDGLGRRERVITSLYAGPTGGVAGEVEGRTSC